MINKENTKTEIWKCPNCNRETMRFTSAEIEAHQLLMRQKGYSSSGDWQQIADSADKIILLAERIKCERARAAMTTNS